MAGRLGLGRVRHLAVSDLWIQQAARRGDIKYLKIPGAQSPSDPMTKYVSEEVMLGHLERLQILSSPGRFSCAPTPKVAAKNTADVGPSKAFVEQAQTKASED